MTIKKKHYQSTFKALVSSVSTNCCGNVVGYLTIRYVNGSLDGQRLPMKTKYFSCEI